MKDESPVDLMELFTGSIKKGGQAIPIKYVKEINFSFKGDGDLINPSTSVVIDICNDIQEYDKKTNMEPRIFILNDNEFALIEAEMMFDNLPVGSWAVFHKVDNRYYLRAVMDLR